MLRLALSATLLCLVAPPLAVGVAAQPETDAAAEEITVFESQLVVDLGRLGARELRRVEGQDLLVFEGGAPRTVTNLQRLRAAGDWRIVIYFDAALSRGRTIRLSSLELGGMAEFLCDLGPVEVVLADPSPNLLFGPSRDHKLLTAALTELAAREIEADLLQAKRKEFKALGGDLALTDPRREIYLLAEEELVRTQVDHLIRMGAQGCDGAPCALLLVSDGFFEDPRNHYLGKERVQTEAGAPSPALLASFDLAITMAAYEWISLALPLREGELDTSVKELTSSDFDRFIDLTGGVQMLPKGTVKPPELPLEALEVSVLPILQPLRRLAEGTAGSVVRVVSQFERDITRLEELWRIYFLTDRALDGRVRPVEVRTLRDSSVLRAPLWVRSSTPQQVAGARLRGLLEGSGEPGTQAIEASVEAGADGVAVLTLKTAWGDVSEIVHDAAIRISLGYRNEGQAAWVGHQVVSAGALGEGGAWVREVQIEVPSGVERLVVAVEALVPRVWGAASLDL